MRFLCLKQYSLNYRTKKEKKRKERQETSILQSMKNKKDANNEPRTWATEAQI